MKRGAIRFPGLIITSSLFQTPIAYVQNGKNCANDSLHEERKFAVQELCMKSPALLHKFRDGEVFGVGESSLAKSFFVYRLAMHLLASPRVNLETNVISIHI